jgi:hypothetical protein
MDKLKVNALLSYFADLKKKVVNKIRVYEKQTQTFMKYSRFS